MPTTPSAQSIKNTFELRAVYYVHRITQLGMPSTDQTVYRKRYMFFGHDDSGERIELPGGTGTGLLRRSNDLKTGALR
jgi:hypothetical protein